MFFASLLSTSFLVYPSASSLSTSKSVTTSGIISQTANLPILKGINIFIEDWITWSLEVVEREVDDIKSRGFNFVRTGIMFYRFYDFNNKIVSPSLDPTCYNSTVAFMNTLKKNGLYLSVVPLEWGDYMYYLKRDWYTNSFFQGIISDYYQAFSGWCRGMGWDNILYTSLWWEPEFYCEWYDGYYTLENNLPVYSQANADWRSWLSSRGKASEDLTLASINNNVGLYVLWSREVFTNITKLKSDAVKRGWTGMKVGSDVGFVNNPNNSPMYMPDAYLNLTASQYLDVIEFHDYFPPGYADSPFVNAAKSLYKPIVMAEVGASWWLGIDATTTAEWLSNVEPKMELMVNEGNGFAIWAWRDYSDFAWGMKDINFIPRQVLSNITEWFAGY